MRWRIENNQKRIFMSCKYPHRCTLIDGIIKYPIIYIGSIRKMKWMKQSLVQMAINGNVMMRHYVQLIQITNIPISPNKPIQNTLKIIFKQDLVRTRVNQSTYYARLQYRPYSFGYNWRWHNCWNQHNRWMLVGNNSIDDNNLLITMIVVSHCAKVNKKVVSALNYFFWIVILEYGLMSA